ncbi:phage baseplate plug family protein [Methylorubrum populi]|uniref:Cyanophage baseplate Pam3 plug gp18 domain-containing protein n=1 Tax=Methylorubrum populi TaxID=223967 RepID=A0A833J9Z9_9HYPH|nr:hypothetical protein [Methylorubrum populi]KAB7788048.1 hypothetical protein F8B43_0053 [Methylorubrum populi]
MAQVEIPLTPEAQSFSITLGGTSYRMRLMFNDVDEGGWTLDIGDQGGTILLAGVPLIPGVDLLSQHAHMDWPGALVVTTDRGTGEAPTFDGLGTTSHLYFVTT